MRKLVVICKTGAAAGNEIPESPYNVKLYRAKKRLDSNRLIKLMMCTLNLCRNLCQEQTFLAFAK